MYTVVSRPVESRTRAIFRRAEFGFLGVIVRTIRQTPCLNGFFSSTGDLLNVRFCRRGLRTSWLIVGIRSQSANYGKNVESVSVSEAKGLSRLAKCPPRATLCHPAAFPARRGSAWR